MYQALIVAAGEGKRTGLGYNKTLYKIKGKPLIKFSVESFLRDSDCEGVVVVCPKKEVEIFKEILHDKATLVIGGKTRGESVFNGLKTIKSKYVMIHDGARPNLRNDALERLKEAVIEYNAVSLALGVKETIKKCQGYKIIEDLDRENVYIIQTPQAFLSKLIKDAHEKAKEKNHEYTDDTSLIQHELGNPIFIVEGYQENIKATTKLDLSILEALL